MKLIFNGVEIDFEELTIKDETIHFWPAVSPEILDLINLQKPFGKIEIVITAPKEALV